MWGAAGLQPPLSKRNLKNTDLVQRMISKVLLDLPFSLNQPPKSADGYTGILKYIIKTKEHVDFFKFSVRFNFPCNITICWLGHFDMIFVIWFLKPNINYIKLQDQQTLKVNFRCAYATTIIHPSPALLLPLLLALAADFLFSFAQYFITYLSQQHKFSCDTSQYDSGKLSAQYECHIILFFGHIIHIIHYV